MATPSQVKSGLDAIAVQIKTARAELDRAKSIIETQEAALNAIPTDFSDVLATINAYAAGSTNYFERLSKDELAAMTTEFTAVVNAATTAKNAL